MGKCTRFWRVQNRMQESLKLFDSICNNKWFTDTSIILCAASHCTLTPTPTRAHSTQSGFQSRCFYSYSICGFLIGCMVDNASGTDSVPNSNPKTYYG